jgi:hypothetical protein
MSTGLVAPSYVFQPQIRAEAVKKRGTEAPLISVAVQDHQRQHQDPD